MKSRSGLAALALAAVAGCTDAGGHRAGGDAGLLGDSGTDAHTPRERAPTHPPPPISGGTLVLTHDGSRVIAADPDHDRVFIVGVRGAAAELEAGARGLELLATTQLGNGEEPGRLAEDGAGRVHVVLRRGGAIGTIDVESGELLARRAVCPEPRGIAYDAAVDRLHVACASGYLVSLEPASGKVTRRVHLDVDLRDVVVVPGGLVVSRFKTAELLKLDGDGNLVLRVVPRSIERGAVDHALSMHDTMAPGVAWRTVATGDGRVFMLHQYGVTRALDVSEPAAAASGTPSLPPAYGAPPGVLCGGIVEQAVSELFPDGTLDMGIPLPVRALTVDVAVSSDGAGLAAVHPGASSRAVKTYASDDVLARGRSPVLCAPSIAEDPTEDEEPVAVVAMPAWSPTPSVQGSPLGPTGPLMAPSDGDALIVQTRSPVALVLYDGAMNRRFKLSLAAEIPNDGHSLFHLGEGIACAQCHPEAGEDGRVWDFSPIGRRRTQSLRTGLGGTEPFHWSGTLPDFTALVHEVFERRMGRPPLGDAQITHLRDWVFSVPPLSPIRAADAPEVTRGRALFESNGVGCVSCHDGAGIAKASNVDVGVDSPNAFQIPALRGVGYRAPFLHDGCAPTLRDRFDPACGGGDEHGKTSQLSAGEIDDLVSYVESL